MIDLHIHTTYSDGQYTPKEIVKMANDLHLTAISITDYDTTFGIVDAMIEAKKYGIEVIPGIEVSTEFYHKGQIESLHILGYNMQDYYNDFLEFVFDLSSRRIFRNAEICKMLDILKINVSYDDVFKISIRDNVCTPHFLLALLTNGYIDNIQDGYDKYFNNGPLSNVEKYKFTYPEVISKILKYGGVPVLAHPGLLNLNDEDLEELIISLKNSRLQGIECYHSQHSPEETQKYIALAKKYDLIITGGSDFHGDDIKPNIKLGCGINNNIAVEDALLNDVKNRYRNMMLKNHKEHQTRIQ